MTSPFAAPIIFYSIASQLQERQRPAYAYAYDDNGNITSITRGTVSVAYEYNGANELIRENNGFTNQTVTYSIWASTEG